MIRPVSHTTRRVGRGAAPAPVRRPPVEDRSTAFVPRQMKEIVGVGRHTARCYDEHGRKIKR